MRESAVLWLDVGVGAAVARDVGLGPDRAVRDVDLQVQRQQGRAVRGDLVELFLDGSDGGRVGRIFCQVEGLARVVNDVVQTQSGVMQTSFSGDRRVGIRGLQRVQIIKEWDEIVHPQMQQNDVEGITGPLAKEVILPLDHSLDHIRADAQVGGVDPLGGGLIIVVEVAHGALDQLVVTQAVSHQGLVEHRLVCVVHLHQKAVTRTGGRVVH